MNLTSQSLNSYKILGILLSYPSKEWIQEGAHFLEILKEENVFKMSVLADLAYFIETIQERDILEVQEYYVSLFDRSRDLSLYLFEHVHGESRDRGQAMLDLLEIYAKHELEPNKNELPDYLPIFLEFLSILPRSEAKDFLNDCVHIIAKIATGLMQRDSLYVALFNGIIHLAGHRPIEWHAPSKDINEWMQNIDDEWAEEEVTFMNREEPQKTEAKGCGGSCSCGSKTNSASAVGSL